LTKLHYLININLTNITNKENIMGFLDNIAGNVLKNVLTGGSKKNNANNGGGFG